MITSLAIRNFKNLANVPGNERPPIEFGPLNVLIGPNGCGKSSFLQAIDFLRAFFHSSLEVYLKDRGWDYRDLPNLRQTGKTIQWEVTAQLGPDEHGLGAGEYFYAVSVQPRRHLGIGQELLTWRPPGREGNPAQKLISRTGRRCWYLNSRTGETEGREVVRHPASIMSALDPARERDRYPQILRFREWVEDFRSYLIWDPKVLRTPDRGRHNELGASGEHLATVIGRLRDSDPSAFEALVRRMRRLFPALTGISVSGRGWGWRTIRLHEGKDRSVVFNSQQMSDGVLRLLAVTSMLYVERTPTVITFEEPENGVHPQLVREVVQILRELTQRKPPNQCQVFFSTHSPYVLDEFYDHPEEVYCMDRPGPQAGATIVRLSENKQLKIARDQFKHSLGEAWTSGLIGATAGVRRR